MGFVFLGYGYSMVLGDLYRGVVRGFKVCGVSGFSLGFGLELYRKLAQPDVCNAFAEENKRHYMSMYSSTYRLFIHIYIYIYVVCMYACMYVCMYVVYIYVYILFISSSPKAQSPNIEAGIPPLHIGSLSFGCRMRVRL